MTEYTSAGERGKAGEGGGWVQADEWLCWGGAAEASGGGRWVGCRVGGAGAKGRVCGLEGNDHRAWGEWRGGAEARGT